MADPVRVARLLRSLADDLSYLADEATASPERRADPMWMRGVKYAFITGIEAAVDVAQHLCSTEGWGPPDTNGDAIALLGRHGVLTADLAESMRHAVGFRNVLVHDYVRVDDTIVTDRLTDLSDLYAFTAQVATWLHKVSDGRLAPSKDSAKAADR